MDLTMIDVSDIDGISLRDEVVILGEQKGRLGSDAITADELARRADSISWECLTSISRRVPRFYRNP
jgi:alanine racemase